MAGHASKEMWGPRYGDASEAADTSVIGGTTAPTEAPTLPAEDVAKFSGAWPDAEVGARAVQFAGVLPPTE